MLYRLGIQRIILAVALSLTATTSTSIMPRSVDSLPPASELMTKLKIQAPQLHRLLEEETPQFYEHAKKNSSLHHSFFTKAWRTTSVFIRAVIVAVFFVACCAAAAGSVAPPQTKRFVAGAGGFAATIYCLKLWFLGILAGWQSSFGSKLAAKPSDLNIPLLKTYFYPILLAIIALLITANTTKNPVVIGRVPTAILSLATLCFGIKLIFFTAPGLRKELNEEREKALRLIYAYLLEHEEFRKNKTLKMLRKHFWSALLRKQEVVHY